MRIIVILSYVSMATLIHAQETKIRRTQVPAPVITAFERSYPHATIRGTNKDVKAGVSFFEIESTDGVQKRDILYSGDGTVQEIEEAMPPSALPSQVTTSLMSTFPHAKIVEVEKSMRSGVIRFEVLIKSGAKKREVVFESDGTPVKKK